MVELRNVCCLFEHERKRTSYALDGINLKIERGEYTAVLGDSGSGKSTLAEILCGRRAPTHGEYFFDGYRVPFGGKRHERGFLYGKVQIIDRNTDFLENLSARENIELALLMRGIIKSKRTELAERLLEQAGLAEQTRLEPRRMSRGQRYRLGLVRAAASPGELFVADEPTENADKSYLKELISGFSYLQKRGKAVIIMTANAEVALNAQKILRLSGGRIISE